jgi:hypothetical protein
LFTLAFDRAPVLAAFVAVETRVRWQLIDLSLLRNSQFTILVVAGTIANIAYPVTVFLSTINLQLVRGLDPMVAGIAFLGPSARAALGGLSPDVSRRFPAGLVVLRSTTGKRAAPHGEAVAD